MMEQKVKQSHVIRELSATLSRRRILGKLTITLLLILMTQCGPLCLGCSHQGLSRESQVVHAAAQFLGFSLSP